jgi:RNA polymerase sigma-70 factor, ECF subfamily
MGGNPSTGMDSKGLRMHIIERKILEEEIQALCKQGEVHLAVDRALRGYGPEIRRMLASIFRDDERAHDAFSLFSERLLKGLPEFRWESSFRTWAHRMARNTCLKLVNAAAAREIPVSQSAIPEHSVRERTTTNPWLRTDVKKRFRDLRMRLAPEEQKLLELRVDRNLPWQEVARAMSTPEESVTGDVLARQATALRQQFLRLKARLRALALEEGLVECEEG